MLYGCQVGGQGRGAHIENIYKLQNRAMRILIQMQIHCMLQIILLSMQDVIRVQNCLFVHDYLNNCLPACFEDYYFKLNYLYVNVQIKNSNLGCLFSPSKNTTKYLIINRCPHTTSQSGLPSPIPPPSLPRTYILPIPINITAH